MHEVALHNDPGRWGASLLNVREPILGSLDAAGARSVVEVGAFAGDLTRGLLDWAGRAGARVIAIDPSPAEDLETLAAERRELELLRATSFEALAEIDLPDAVIIDGDHNYFTVSEELRLIASKAPRGGFPLLILHDVGWPHGRRDSYYVPERIPEQHRQPIVERGGLMPGDPGLIEGGLPLVWVAEREGGPRNGVLTAVDDFLATRDDLRLAIVPAFFGVGFVWSQEAPWADRVAAVLEPLASSPVIERLEANRVYHIAFGHQLYSQIMALSARVAELEAQNRELRERLDRIARSRAFAVAQRLSRIRRAVHRGEG
jgi:SAM-dependent methyltransferase